MDTDRITKTIDDTNDLLYKNIKNSIKIFLKFINTTISDLDMDIQSKVNKRNYFYEIFFKKLLRKKSYLDHILTILLDKTYIKNILSENTIVEKLQTENYSYYIIKIEYKVFFVITDSTYKKLLVQKINVYNYRKNMYSKEGYSNKNYIEEEMTDTIYYIMLETAKDCFFVDKKEISTAINNLISHTIQETENLFSEQTIAKKSIDEYYEKSEYKKTALEEMP